MKEEDNLKAIDLHNKVTGEELERLLKMQLAALAEDPRLAHELPPLMVWGAPGLGKSSILKDVARNLALDSSMSVLPSASRWIFAVCRFRARTA